jgi:ubiquinone/menaquinone biosynthesis C-methylase UbiE
MVEQARQKNRHGEKVAFHLNVASDLALFPSGSFDFALTLIALQHTPGRFQRKYLAEFMRVLKPGGVLYFNVMEPRTLWRRWAPEWMAELWRAFRNRGKAYIPIYPVVHSEVLRALGPEAELVSYSAAPIEPPFSHRLQYGTYCVRRR